MNNWLKAKFEIAKIKNPIPKLVFLITGLVSTVWFLVRVIPKPTRATYPCMKTAMPLMSGIVVYLLSITGSAYAFKKTVSNIKSVNKAKALGYLLAAIVLIIVASATIKQESSAFDLVDQTYFKANEPIGVAKGFKPGRVVWVWNTNATPENFVPTNTASGWWAKKTNKEVVDSMMVKAVLAYTEKGTIKDAWDVLFKHFNLQHSKGEVGYKKGEKMYIKVNITNSYATGSTTKKADNFDRMDSTPEVMLALLKQLIEEVGVAQEDIYIGDPFRMFQDIYWDVCHTAYPNVVYCDGFGLNGRHQTVPTASHQLFTSDGKYKFRIPQEYVNSEYFINLPCLKTHDSAGITLGAKNHQGSILQDGASSKSQSAYDMHYSLPGHDQTDGGHYRYRHLVDYLAHEQLGGKTLVTFIDGIWAGRSWEGFVEKWVSAPFNNDYPNSIFVSQDLVAIDAVCYDFLLEEYKNKSNKSKYAYMLGADDYLFQAADPKNWPSGLVYNPENNNKLKQSLGVYEHWNNATDKKYSRNLATGNGIELVQVNMGVKNSISTFGLNESHWLTIYPTATSNTLNASWNLENAEIISANIISMNGKKTMVAKDRINPLSKNQVSVNVSALQQGSYIFILMVKHNGETLVLSKQFQKIVDYKY